MKTILAASVGVNIALGAIFFINYGHMKDAVEKAGEATGVANANKMASDNNRDLLRSCIADRDSLIEQNNAAVKLMQERSLQRDVAVRELIRKNGAATQRVSSMLAQLGKTPVGATCEAKLEFIGRQLDGYRGIVIQE